MRCPALLVLVLSVALGGLLVACEDSARQRETTAPDFCERVSARVDSFMAGFAGMEPEGGRYGGTAVVGTVGELVVGLNGFAAQEVAATQHQIFVSHMTLIQYDENLEPVPYLARSWDVEETPEGLIELTFHLRDDVPWHDGELTTAHDVAFTFLTATNPLSGYPNPSFFQNYLSGD